MKKLLLITAFATAVFSLHAQTLTCSGAATTCPCGSGAYAEYYAGYFNDVQTYFTSNSPGLTRNDPNIDYTADNSWGNIAPPATGSNTQPDNYSTRWSGRIFFAAGTYSLWLTSDDASWLWLGSGALATNPTTATAIINNGGLHSATTKTALVTFTSSCLQDFKVHFGENTGQNRCNLEYASAGPVIARQAIPNSAYCPCMSNAVLPIELKKFSGTANKDNIVLRWTTATEKNNDHFTVYRSADGQNWSVLGSLPGAGTSNVSHDYSMTDNSPLAGVNYYYLAQIDKDGQSEQFDVIQVDFSNSAAYIKLFPNPFQDKFSITSSTEWTSADAVEVFDAMGKPVQLPLSRPNKFTFELNTADIPKGNYTVKIKTTYQVIVRKMVKS